MPHGTTDVTFTVLNVGRLTLSRPKVMRIIIKTLSSYRVVNTFRVGYKNELVNVVHGYNR